MVKRLLKYAAYALAALVVLAIAGVLATVALVDGAFVKAQLERRMSEDKHRTLAIEGEPRVRFLSRGGHFARPHHVERTGQPGYLRGL
jgi:uncharacterized protein involved in outer membrane biogenesis